MKYTDPDGREDFSYPFDFSDYLSPFGFAFRNDGAVKYGILVEDALDGNTYSGDIVKQVNIEAAKEAAIETLDITGKVSGGVSEVTGNLALEGAFIDPEGSAVLGTVSDVSGFIEVAALQGKAELTKDPKDKLEANKKTQSFAISSFCGHILEPINKFIKIAGKKGLTDEAENIASNVFGVIASEVNDKVMENEKKF